MENFTTLPEVFDVFEFQGWNKFLRILENIYTGLISTFYSTLVSSDEDNISLRSIIGSFEIQVLPSNIAQITNTLNDGVLCRAGEKWWEDLGAIVLTKKRNLHGKDIQMSHLLVSVSAVYSVVQHIMLPQSGNIDVMTEVDHMVMFYPMTRRRINLVRLILDFILVAVNAKRRKHATLPYGMFLTKVFIKA